MPAARLLILCSLLCACISDAAESPDAEPVVSLAPAWGPVLVDGPPHVRQRPDFCGEACVEMALRGLGHDVDQDMVFALTGVDPALGRGAWTPELKRAVEQLGFEPGPVWYRYDAKPDATELDAAWSALHSDLAAGIPSIVCMHYDDRPRTTEHFRLVLGYDPATDEVLYHEPAEENGAFRRMDRSLFLSLWPLEGRGDWTLIRLRLDPQDLRPPLREGHHSAGDYVQHVRTLRETILPEGFTVVVEPPFVVVGDEEPEKVRARAAWTVRTYSQALERDFFATAPPDIYTIWLFGSADSYYRHAEAIWGERPSTPYGYASDDHKALVMNIATGGGTLVHEIVHPYVYADFPDCPPWLNEGLASLFEHVSIEDGHIHGHTNWRLDGLQRAIDLDAVPSFRWLMERSFDQFYREDPGTNYAQSRYLCLYLQEKGLIREYYRKAKENHAGDPTGYVTLTQLLDIRDHAVFLEAWKAWVMQLEP